MKILANVAHPEQMDIINVFKYMGIEVTIGNNNSSLYASIETIKPNYLFLDDKTIIGRQSLLQKYKLPTISYGAIPDEIAKATNVRCILADNVTDSTPAVSITNCGNIIDYRKASSEYRLESDIFFALQGPLYKSLVEHVLVTTDYKVKCFSGGGHPSSATIGRLDIPQLMALCSSAKLVLCEYAGLASVLILHDIAAIEIRIVDWTKVDEMLKDEKVRRAYIANQKLNIRTVFDVAADIFPLMGESSELTALAKTALEHKRKFI